MPDLLFCQAVLKAFHFGLRDTFRYPPEPETIGPPADIFGIAHIPRTLLDRCTVLAMATGTVDVRINVALVNLLSLFDSLRIRPPSSRHMFVCILRWNRGQGGLIVSESH